MSDDTLTPVPVLVAAPLLRGWAHLVSFPVWMTCGLALVVLSPIDASGRVLLGIYVVGTGTMFGASALYHRGRWRPTLQGSVEVTGDASGRGVAGCRNGQGASALGRTE